MVSWNTWAHLSKGRGPCFFRSKSGGVGGVAIQANKMSVSFWQTYERERHQICLHMGVAQNETGGVTHALTRVPFWYRFFEPQPHGIFEGATPTSYTMR